MGSLAAVSPDFRKVALIAASLGLLVSLFVALRPDDEPAAPATTARVTTAIETHAATTAPPPGADLELEIRAGTPVGGVRRVTVEPGPVSISVISDTAGELHVHGYDLRFPIAASGTQEVSFEATAPGIFEIELEGSHAVLAQLEVRP